MKIKKTFQGTVPENKILNTYSNSKTDVYSCDYINNSVIESGSNENGSWVKWSDGTMICHCSITETITPSTQWGSLYYGRSQATINFPCEFVDIPDCVTELVATSNTSFIPMNYEAPKITKTSYSGYAIARPNSNNTPVKFTVRAMGRWK